MGTEQLEGIVKKFVTERQSDFAPAHLSKIDWGRNSAVFRLGDKALKFYTGDIDQLPVARAQVEFYQDVTNLAAKLAEETDLQITLPQGAGSYPVRINPVEELVEIPEPGLVVSVSTFIESPSAMTVFKTTIVDDPRRVIPEGKNSYDWQQHSEVNPVRQFLLKRGLTMPHQVHPYFDQIDDQLNRGLGVEGIFAGLSNTKMLFEPETESLKFVITDLCLEVTNLRRENDDQYWRNIRAEKHGLP